MTPNKLLLYFYLVDYSVAVASGAMNTPPYLGNTGQECAGATGGQPAAQSAQTEGGPSGSNSGPSGAAHPQPTDLQMYRFDSKPPPYAP